MGRGVVALVAVVLLALALGPVRPATATTSAERQAVSAGVSYERVEREGLVAHVARVAPEAAFVRPVLAADSVGGGARESVSSMCRRAGGVVCVNADFAACPTCREPFGGVVVDGQVLRSPHHVHEQLSFTTAGMTTERWAWGGRLVAEQVWWVEAGSTVPVGGSDQPRRVELRRERRELPIAGLNTGPVPDGVVLYTPSWGPQTPGSPLEVLLATDAPIGTGTVQVEIGPQRAGAGPVPSAGAVLGADGRAVDELARLADDWRRSDAQEKRLVLETAISAEVLQSVGGHPVLLRDGRRQSWSRDDPKARGRHPRTLAGWTAAGEVLLVVVDGRRPGHSDGLTLDEAADLLTGLGAVHGINLDGGGSSTFVGPCPTGPCVLNQPSDGRERLVPGALVLLGDGRPVTPVRPDEAPPLAPPAAPTEPDPASTAHIAPEPGPAPRPDPAPDAAPADADAPAAATGEPPAAPEAAMPRSADWTARPSFDAGREVAAVGSRPPSTGGRDATVPGVAAAAAVAVAGAASVRASRARLRHGAAALGRALRHGVRRRR